MGFAYGGDIGQRSVDGIKAFETNAGFSLTDTNDDPPGSGAFHGTHNAVDFSNGGDAGSPEMDAFAAYCYKYSDYLLELIHVNRDGTGTYVKMGAKVDATFYESILWQHHNHVHVAITNSGLAGIAKAGGGNPNVPASGSDPGTDATLTGVSIPGLSDLSAFYKFFTDPHNYMRVALFVGGAGLLFVGARAIMELA